MTAHLNVVEFPCPDYKDPVKALRNLADDIEAGAYGEVGSCGVVLIGDTMEIFGSGSDSEAPSIALLFHAAFMRLSSAVKRHGGDE